MEQQCKWNDCQVTCLRATEIDAVTNVTQPQVVTDAIRHHAVTHVCTCMSDRLMLQQVHHSLRF